MFVILFVCKSINVSCVLFLVSEKNSDTAISKDHYNSRVQTYDRYERKRLWIHAVISLCVRVVKIILTCHVSFLNLVCLSQELVTFETPKWCMWLKVFSTRSPVVTFFSRHAQSGRWSSFRKRVWFIESQIILIISFLLVVLFTQFIVDKMKKKGLLCQVKQLNHILLK